jgi:hypothetical protein
MSKGHLVAGMALCALAAAPACGSGVAAAPGVPATAEGGIGNAWDASNNDTGVSADANTSSDGSTPDVARTVLGCSSLPQAGMWENISPPGLSDTTGLVVDPFSAGTVWLGTTNGGFFKSTNCGADFVHINTGRNGQMLDTQGQGLLSIAVDPVHQGVIYVFKYGGNGLFKSTDGGVDWDQMITPGSDIAKAIPLGYIDSISMDPTDSTHLVVSNHITCNPPYDPTCEAETTDGGETWRVFKAPDYSNWEEQAGVWIIDKTTWLYGGRYLWLTTDNGADWTNLAPDPGAAYWGFSGGENEIHSIPRGPDGAYYLTSNQGVVRSTDGGMSWSILPNTGGQKVPFVIGGDRMYAMDSWNGSNVWSAPVSDPTQGSQMTGPPIGNTGCPYLDYDTAHNVLYASCFSNGAWRMVMQ